MARRIVPPVICLALVGCVAGSSGGFQVWSHPVGRPGAMVERGPDDAFRLDSLNRHGAFDVQNSPARSVDVWDRASVNQVDPAEEGLKRLDREAMRLTGPGDLEFEGTDGGTVIEELIARCEGVEFFDTGGDGRRLLEGVVLTAKAGRIEKDMVFPYLRAVFQMNGFDLVPIEIPYYGRGFQVVRLEDFDWVESTAVR